MKNNLCIKYKSYFISILYYLKITQFRLLILVMKGLLFDIDGTLLKSHGIGRIPLEKAILDVYNLKVDLTNIDWLGRTDLDVIYNVLTDYGINDINIKKNLKKLLFKFSKYFYEYSIINKELYEIIPNVDNLLNNLKDFSLGILTGNIKENAYVKLKMLSLDKYFPYGIGAYGDDNRYRGELVKIAIKRMNEFYGKLEDFIIIGDSFRDIISAKENNIKILAVSTGKNTYDELKLYNPDFLVENYNDINNIISIIVNS